MGEVNLLDIYLQASEIVQTGVMWLRQSGHIIGVNTLFSHELGYDKEELATKTIFEINPHLNLLTWKKTWKDLTENGQITFESEHMTAEGRLYPIRMKGLLIDTGPEKVCVGLVENLLETTRYKDMLDHVTTMSRIGGWELDLFKEELILTNEVYKLLELDPNEKSITSESYAEIAQQYLGKESFEQLDENLKDTIKSGKSFTQELILRLPSGKERHIEFSAFPVQSENTTVKLYGAMRDTSEVAARIQPLEFTQYTLDNAAEMIFWMDKNGDVQYANNAVTRILGYSQEEILSMNATDLIPIMDTKYWGDLWEKLKREKVFRVRREKKAKDGHLVPVETISTYIEHEGRELICKYARDLTELEEQRKNLELNKLLFDQSGEMMFWINKDGTIFNANATAIETLGYSKEELRNMHTFELSNEIPESKWAEHWEKVRQDGYYDKEAVLIRKDGSSIPVSIYAEHIDYMSQEYHCATVRDLTLKKKRDEIIQIAYHTLNQSPDMIFWLNTDGSFFYFNNAFCKTTGYTREEVQNMALKDFFPELTREYYEGVWKDLAAGKNVFEEKFITTKDGRKIPIETSISLVNYEGNVHSCTFLRDITERKRSQQEILKREQRFRSIMSSATDAVVTIDSNGHVLTWNIRAEKIFGWKAEDMIGSDLSRIMPEQYRERHAQGIKRYLRTKEANLVGSVVELEGLHKNGHTFPIEISLGTWQSDEEVYFCGIIRDIAERKEKEKRLHQALEEISELKKKVELENIYLQSEIDLSYNFNNIISASKNYRKIFAQIEQVADKDATVLILGETGTGKELLARAIHNLSNRSERQLVKVNCASLPEHLIESELFGHEKGSFTGAFQKKIGRFELAHGGTILLDEIGELPLDLQSKLLRVLQEGEFERVGGVETIKVDARVIAATNRDLEALVNENKFRQDLFYRLNVFPIYNIPLRERREDIPLLIRHFVKKYSEKSGKKIEKIPQSTIEKLFQYEFPGNIRELENIIERAVILSKGSTLQADLSFLESKKKKQKGDGQTVFPSFDEVQRTHIIEALKLTNGKVSGEAGAAQLLGLNDKTLFSKMKKFNIGRDDYSFGAL